MGDGDYSIYVALFAGSIATMAMTAVPMAYLRALQKPWIFVSVSLTKLLTQVTLNVVFVVVLKWGPLGVIASTLITGVLIGGGISIWMFTQTGFGFSKEISVRLIRFGFPIALASAGAFYTTYGDRFFLQHFWGLAEVGLYALAYRFAFALSSLVYGTFDQAWSAQSYVVYKQSNRDQMFGRVFLMMMLGMIFVGTSLSVMVHDILRIMSDASFGGAWIAVPPLIAAYVIRCAGDFCGFGIRLHEQTRHFFWASLISVAVMTVGYAGLIPKFGALGAALATLAGMCAEFWWIRRVSYRLAPIPLPWTRVISAAAVCIVAFIVSLFLPSADLLFSIISRTALLSALAVAIFYSPIVGRDERAASMELLQDSLRKFGLRPQRNV